MVGCLSMSVPVARKPQTIGMERVLRACAASVLLATMLACTVSRSGPPGQVESVRMTRATAPQGERGAPLESFWQEGSRPHESQPIPITSTLYASIAEEINPSVVTIFTRSKVGGVGDPLGLFFFQLPIPGLGIPGLGREAKSLGSGFIISQDGYVVTNAHVVRAQKLEVFLQDSNEAVAARVVGYQRVLDIALLRIPPSSELTVAPLGDSDTVRTGDFILAIGNPFGLRHTVTTGNVSAVQRHVPISRRTTSPHGFIQIDAPINPGNSGGPLLNLHGEVVGINTAILSTSGGSIGIGFAVPINYAKEFLPRLRRDGKADLAYLGVKIGEVTEAIATSKNLSGSPRGALVVEVVEKTPAERAGLRAGDIILSFNNRPVASDAALLPMALASVPGRRIPLVVWRASGEHSLFITPARF